mgnify:CR=1 FL=1
MARQSRQSGVVVIGLGRFGKSLALELMEEGTEVLGIDEDPRTVQRLAGRLTHVVEADSTNEEALRQLSVHEFDRAVVGVGSDLEASILTSSILVNFGIRDIWAKAISQSHGKILARIGAVRSPGPLNCAIPARWGEHLADEMPSGLPSRPPGTPWPGTQVLSDLAGGRTR